MTATPEFCYTERQTFRDIAAAIRAKYPEGAAEAAATYRPSEMAAAITGIPAAGGGASWSRPKRWPDLSQIPIDYENDEEVAYYTLDNTKEYIPADYCWLGLHLLFDTVGASAILQRGTVENGVFTPTAEAKTVSCASVNATYYLYDSFADAAEPFPVYRLTTNGGHLRECLFTQIPVATTGLSAVIYPKYTPCVERVGNLPYLTSVTANTNGWNAVRRHGTMWLQRDALRFAAKSTLKSMQYAWVGCYNLQSLDLSGWDTSNWQVTTLYLAWDGCYSLQALDLSGWDTSGWKVTTLESAWSGCYSLQALDLSGWDTSGWSLTSVKNIVRNDRSLRKLNLSSLDLSKITTANGAQGAFDDCPVIEDFTPPKNLGISFSLAASCLTLASVTALFEALPTVTDQTVKIAADAFRRLDAATLAIATAKDWTVASA